MHTISKKISIKNCKQWTKIICSMMEKTVHKSNGRPDVKRMTELQILRRDSE